MKKIIIIILFLLVALYFRFSYKSWYECDYFRLLMINVGQGDSILIVTPHGETILIDGGPNTGVLRGLGRILPMWLRHIDLVVLTHAHDDHLIGLIEVLSRYDVDRILINDSGYSSPPADNWRKLISSYQSEIIKAKKGMSIKFSEGCSLEILESLTNKNSDENNYSIISLFSCLGKKVLLTGDAGIKVEEELLFEGVNLDADILKISHHGSITGTSIKLLDAINPKIALISVGKDNSFGHPNQDIIHYLVERSIRTLRTDISGDLYILANNKEIILKK